MFSLLSDPAIKAELCSFIHSNKWALNPEKLAAFSKENLVGEATKKYLNHIINEEMPRGLKKYLELELMLRIQMKAKNGILLETARSWLHHEGFRYMKHKKGLYYDGHKHPDVVEYRQNVFIPTLTSLQWRLVEFEVGNVEKEVVKKDGVNYVERQLVMLFQDKSTMQANDGQKRSWIPEGEQPLRKKGAGHGIHHSDVICSTFGWLKDASQTLEYGKNYDGYWNGELFIKQVHIQLLSQTNWSSGLHFTALRKDHPDI